MVAAGGEGLDVSKCQRGAWATSGVTRNMFTSGSSESDRGLACLGNHRQTRPINNGLQVREMDELLLLLLFRCCPTPGRGADNFIETNKCDVR